MAEPARRRDTMDVRISPVGLDGILGLPRPAKAGGVVLLLSAGRQPLPGCHRRDGSVLPVRHRCRTGSLLSQLSALASPETFVWSRLLDATLSSADPLAWEIHVRVERWALDEVPLPGMLVHQMLEWLYRENRLCRGNLQHRPEDHRAILPVASHACGRQHGGRDRAPGIGQALCDAMPGPDVRVLEFPGEVGVGLQHLAILVGPQAYARVWPEIISWLEAHC